MLARVRIGDLEVSRLILGGNPFSGFSHQSPEVDQEMMHYYTTAKIKETYRRAEELGINTHIGRADHHIMRVLMEYWDEGGTIQWIAQTCPELGEISRGVRNAIKGGAKACFVHGGVADHLFAQGRMEEVADAIKMIHDAGMPAGIAAHNPEVLEWAEENLDVDFYMCSYYNSARRDRNPEHVPGAREWFWPEDRERMARTIAKLSKPAVHYKVLAAGRNDPREAFSFVGRHMRPCDAVCVGIVTKYRPRELEEDVRLVEELVEGVLGGC